MKKCLVVKLCADLIDDDVIGATGRNGGHLRPDYFGYASDIMSKFGPEEAVRHNKFERSNFESVLQLIKDEGIDCECDQNGESWRVFMSQAEFSDALYNLSLMRDIGGDVHDVRVFMRAEARRVRFHEYT